VTELVARDISVHAAGHALVSAASFRLAPGELVALLGPNGAGKSSLIRAALGLQKCTTGQATIDGRDTQRMDAMARARSVAYLPQSRALAWPSSVRDVVALGRFSYGAALGRLRGRNAVAVDRALADCDLEALARRSTDTLSGGELARVHCARAFAAEAPLLIADEPTAALDPHHQFRIMDLIAAFVARGGGALVVLHDIDLAARYASRLMWMKEGRIVADGPPAETLTEARLRDVHGVRARIDNGTLRLDGVL
jgi:iron complex transport system ATP-binding protein